MKVLYINRKPNNNPPAWKVFLKNMIFGYPLKGQDGFFEGSLLTAFPELVTVSIEEALKKTSTLDKTYDWVILNLKCYGKNKPMGKQDLSWLKSLKRCNKALYINSARSDNLPDEKLLNIFDVIFKRELLKDLDRYNIRTETMKKLHVTMLSCPLIPANFSRSGKIVSNPISLNGKQHFKYNVTFIGAHTNDIRKNVLTDIKETSIDFYGGLYHRHTGLPLDWEGYSHPVESKILYMKTILNSRINLALDGKGAFTFRHLDIWYTGSFMLAVPSILDLQLPGGIPEEDIHFSCFRNKDELEEKVSFYLANEEDRLKIARTGKEFFQSIYDYSKHGKYISDVLNDSKKFI